MGTTISTLPSPFMSAASKYVGLLCVEYVTCGKNVPSPTFIRIPIFPALRFETTISGMLSPFTSTAAAVCGKVPTVYIIGGDE